MAVLLLITLMVMESCISWYSYTTTIFLHLIFLLHVFLPCLHLIFGVFANIMTCHGNQSQYSLAVVITTFLCPGGVEHHSFSYCQPSFSLVQPPTVLTNPLGAVGCSYAHLEYRNGLLSASGSPHSPLPESQI